MIDIIQAVELARETGGQQALVSTAEFNMFRGAIAGALIIGLAFLSGLAIMKRGALAWSAAFMVGTAAVLELFWLGFFQVPNFNLIVLLQGLFAASVIIFLSAGIRVARNNAALGGVMFAGSLVFVGLGIINFLGRADFAILMLRGLVGIGVFAFGLSLWQAIRGDSGARLILPGSALTLAAVFIFATSGAGGLLGHGLFTLGILAASLVAMTERSLFSPYAAASAPIGEVLDSQIGDPVSSQLSGQLSDNGSASTATPAALSAAGLPDKLDDHVHNHGSKRPISADRLVEVLDFSGIGVWDWGLEGVYQGRSLCTMLGADCDADFTPQAMRAFVSPSHLSIFEEDILGHGKDDGGFDTLIKIHNGRTLRVRGARRVDENGRLERVVAFFEFANQTGAVPLPGAGETADKILQERVQETSLASDAKSTDASDKSKSATGVMSGGIAGMMAGGLAGLAGKQPTDDERAYSPIMAFDNREIIGYRAQAGRTANDVATLIEQSTQFLAQEQDQHRNGNSQNALASDAYVAIPVSWDVANSAGFLENTLSAMRKSAPAYGTIVFEMSGFADIRDPRIAKSLFAQLRQSGASIAYGDDNLDSTVLGNLHRFEFDYIRMGADTVMALDGDDKKGRGARTLLTLGRDLGLRLVAEGIDDKVSVAKLTAMGCQHGQGNFLAADRKLGDKAAPVEAVAHRQEDGALPASHDDGSHQADAVNTAMSLDDWRANDQAGDPKVPGPLPSLRAAFVDSVPSFGPETQSNLADNEADEQKSQKLPKWRTWGRNMR